MPANHTPRRIVSLQPSATVILASVGQLHRVVACTKYCADVCPEIKSSGCTIVADSWTAKTDEILAARPDLVIAAVPYQEKAVTEILKSGARFLGLAPKTLQDIYTDIAAIAGVVGESARGEQVIAEMQEELENVRAAVNGARRPRVFCEEWGKPLIASQPWVVVLIAAWCGAGDRVPLEKIVLDRGWSELTAARQNHVYCINDELLNTPAPTLVRGLHALAAAIHPERFPQPSLGLRCIQRSRS